MRDWMWWIAAPLGMAAVIAGVILVPLALITLAVITGDLLGIAMPDGPDNTRPWGIAIAVGLLAFIAGQWFVQLRK